MLHLDSATALFPDAEVRARLGELARHEATAVGSGCEDEPRMHS